MNTKTLPGPASLPSLSSLGAFVTAFVGRLRHGWAAGIPCRNDVLLAFTVSTLWALFYNISFWQKTFAAMWHPGAGAMAFMAALLLLVVTVQATLVLAMPTRWLLRTAVSLLFLVASLSSYFVAAYGAIMDKDMLRNVFATDRAEVGNLLGPALFVQVVLFGLLPAVLVWRVRLPASSFRTQLKQRGGVLAVAWLLCVGALFGSSADFAVFLREYKPVRFTLSPAAPVSSAIGLLADTRKHSHHGPLIDVGGQTTRMGAVSSRPLVILLVVGETARAANFELGGYARATNPNLKAVDGLTYFSQATSCGTSTAISVPCMFSPFGRERFDVARAADYVNLLDTLHGAGFDIEWRDNNAGCKGVCARIPTTDIAGKGDPALCQHSYCFDEILLKGLDERLSHITRDTVIVFHMIGSHGPAYAERYPLAFEKFKPACQSIELQKCTVEEVVNAYDNTIAYTDYVLSQQIALLKTQESRIDSLFVYASDHGESLGERGLYLHGLPYAFAPATQKQVPMLLWTSSSYRARAHLDQRCVAGRAQEPVSHDNLYHTVLGAAGLRNQVYDPLKDLLGPCRNTANRLPDPPLY